MKPNKMRAFLRLRHFLKGRVPRQLVMQITERCNGLCPQCEMRATHRFQRNTLTRNTTLHILDSAAARGFHSVSFTGGEPLLMLDDLTRYLRHAGHLGIHYTRTGTNGFLFLDSDEPGFRARIHRLAERLASTPLRNLWISLDSCVPEVHEKIRGLPGVVAGIRKALPIFHEHGIYPTANLGINRSIGGKATDELLPQSFDSKREYAQAFLQTYHRAFRRFYQFVIDLGFTMVSACYPMSAETPPVDAGREPPYGAISSNRLVRFTRDEKAMLFEVLLATVPQFRSDIRVISPCSSLYTLCGQYSGRRKDAAYACRGGVDFFFVSAKDGDVYPCGYRGGENLGRLWTLDIDAIPALPTCTACDWECFRDPSDVLSPMTESLNAPWRLLRRFWRDPEYMRLWVNDIRYAAACSLFDGRKPPDPKRLRAFRSNADSTWPEHAPKAYSES